MGWLKACRQWLADAAASPHSFAVLMGVSFLNSSIFPVSPYYLFVPIVLAKPEKWASLSFWCALFCVAGGVVGWWLGAFFWDVAGPWFYACIPGFTPEAMEGFRVHMQKAAFLGILAIAVSPVPYKVLCAACGVFQIPLPLFLIASFVGRFGRLLVTGAAVRYGGLMAPHLLRRPWIAGILVAFILLGYYLYRSLRS